MMHRMTAATFDSDRRQFLIAGTSALALAAAAGTAVPFLASWQPTEATRLGGLPTRVDLSKLSVGEGIKLLWRGQPMWVVHRDPAAALNDTKARELLKDPDSVESIQPPYARNAHRGRRADVMVLTAVCTHLSCLPQFKGLADAELGPSLASGFYCPCHGSRFDTSGRVLKGSPAARNLDVPAYYFDGDDAIIIGADAPA
jgi:ubiquinol-cytochrome c reductase iron-sulfur subunit